MMGGGGNPIHGYGRESLFYASTRSEWHTLSAEKNLLSLSHLVEEILGHKLGLIFQFWSSWTLFIGFRSFWSLIFFLFYKNLDPIKFIFIASCTEYFVKYPPPWGHRSCSIASMTQLSSSNTASKMINCLIKRLCTYWVDLRKPIIHATSCIALLCNFLFKMDMFSLYEDLIGPHSKLINNMCSKKSKVWVN